MGDLVYLVNGDAEAERLHAHLDPPARILVWAEVLHEGPLSGHLGTPAWRTRRAAFYTSCGWGSHDENLRRLEAWDADLATIGPEDRVILRVEDDLFDQLLLVRHLTWLAGRNHPPGLVLLQRIRRGDGETLDTNPITPAHLDLAAATWLALAAPSPEGLIRLLDADIEALPDLRPSLVRHLEEFPGLTNGLSRTEGTALWLLAEQGPLRFEALFDAVAAGEDRPFLGDTTFLWLIHGLVEGPRPLLDITQVGTWALTADGRAIVESEADRVTLHGIDRWRGGVHLRGRAVGWRWDAARHRLVSTDR
jgi:hypothetical protein